MSKELNKASALEYWMQELKKAKASEGLIYDFYEKEYEIGSYTISIDKDYGFRLNKICKNNKLLIFAFLVSVLKVNLSKYMLKKYITVGIPYYNGANKKISNKKILPVTSYVDYEKTYLEYMTTIKEQILDTYRNQEYLNLDVLLKNNLTNDVMELTPISISMKNLHEEKYIDYIISSNKNEISFLFELINDNSISLKIIYNVRKFSQVTIEKLAKSSTNVLMEVLNNYNQKIKDITILSEKEENRILYEFTDTRNDYPKNKTIQELFEEQVEKTPNNIAVIFEDKEITYNELNEKSNSLARILRNKGVKADCIVAIMVERSLEMIIGIMGILKSGGAYLPIDSNYPKERIEYMLKDSGSDIVLSKKHLLVNIEFDGEFVDLLNEELFINGSSSLEKINKPSDLAYVIYTSGTTGNPKGVMIEHRQLNNFVQGIVKETKLNLYKNILCITTICFDIFGLETLVPLTQGLNIVVANMEEQIDGKKLGQLIEKNGVETMQSTPSRLKILLENKAFKESMRSLKLLLIGGEEVHASLVTKLHESIDARIYNVYGPTETTIWSTAKELNKDKKITIGKPISNTQIYILNNNAIMPIGVAGELCISGDGISRGYLNKPELTAEKFVENPYEIGKKMYRTGDLARWLPDGNLEFLGRIDNQVKIRGFRIELSEIENRLLNHDDVKEATVVIKENKDDDKYICAYVVSEKETKELNLKNYLEKSLPQYMIPTYLVKLKKMPLTANGKIDRKSLPEPSLETVLNEYEAPRNETEKGLIEIWSEIFCIKEIGINDNFFELGGHSLKAIIIAKKIYEYFNIEVSLGEIFRRPTIKEISAYIENERINGSGKKINEYISDLEQHIYFETSITQKKMYEFQQINKQSILYNMLTIIELTGDISVRRFKESLQKLIQRHDTLRASFEVVNNEVMQKINCNINLKFEYIENMDMDISILVKDFEAPFELSVAPLFRVRLVRQQKNIYLIMLDMHNIIIDGNSKILLFNEFTELYKGNELNNQNIQYKDYIEWYSNLIKSGEIEKQEKYWLNLLRENILSLELPIDYIRPEVRNYEGGKVDFILDNEFTSKLRLLAQDTKSTMHIVLLSAINILLSKYSNQEDIIIGNLISGRNHIEFQNVVGLFENKILMRNYPKGELTYKEFLNNVKENTIKAYENQDYRFESLVSKLNLWENTNRNPIFDVMLVFNVESEEKDLKIPIFQAVNRTYYGKRNKQKLDLMIVSNEYVNGIIINFFYNSEIFKKRTIENMTESFKKILNLIIEDKTIKIKEVKI